MVVYTPYEMPQIYIVDQGPVYSGPGIYTNPTLVVPRRMPRYPYVGPRLSDVPAALYRDAAAFALLTARSSRLVAT